jgi:hypothetical protein
MQVAVVELQTVQGKQVELVVVVTVKTLEHLHKTAQLIRVAAVEAITVSVV